MRGIEIEPELRSANAQDCRSIAIEGSCGRVRVKTPRPGGRDASELSGRIELDGIADSMKF